MPVQRIQIPWGYPLLTGPPTEAQMTYLPMLRLWWRNESNQIRPTNTAVRPGD